MIRNVAGKFWWLLPVSILIASVSFAGYLLRPDSAGSVELVDCAIEAPDDYTCWQRRLQDMVETQSPKAALDDARKYYNTVPLISGNCHQFAHEIGRAAGNKYTDVAEAYRHGDDFCASGYYHGVLEAVAQRVGPDRLMGMVNEICLTFKNEEPYSLTHYNCAHGLGHGMMAVVHGELFDAMEGCDNYTDSWERESCHSGVFMENIISKNNPNHTTTYLRDDEPLYPCTDVETQYKQACYINQTSHALTVVGGDFNRVFELCLEVEEPFDATCLQSLGRDASGNSTHIMESAAALCEQGPTAFAQEHCFIGAAKDFIYHFQTLDDGLNLCRAATVAAVRESCLREAEFFHSTL